MYIHFGGQHHRIGEWIVRQQLCRNDQHRGQHRSHVSLQQRLNAGGHIDGHQQNGNVRTLHRINDKRFDFLVGRVYEVVVVVNAVFE